jgi:hypothetical protein
MKFGPKHPFGLLQLDKRILILIVPLILMLGVFAAASESAIPQAHAQLTGLVCLADPSTASSATPCPASPPVFDGPAGQQIRVGVFISGSDGLDGFDVTILANHNVLRPAGFDLTGTILIGTPVLLVECLSGVLIQGSSCASVDTVDTLHVSAISQLGSANTIAPTTGLLFTAIYNVTALTSAGGISMSFQSGCANTSVSPNICVTVPNGTATANVETVQGATFSNSDSATMAAVDVTASPTSFGPEFPGASNTATVTATAVNGYPGFASDSVSFTTKASIGLTATLSGVNPCATGGVSCSVTLALSASASGNYFVTVYGTYSTSDPSGNPDTLVGTVTLSVVVSDFGFTVSPTSISFASGQTGTSTVTLTSLNGFAGNVVLSTGTVLPAGLTITYSPSTVTLTASGSGSTQTSTATFSASPTVATTYRATIRATSGTRVKTSPSITVTVSAAVADFSVSANPTTLSTTVGVAGTSIITVSPLNGFAGTVALAVTTNSTNLSCTLSSTSITGGSGTSTLSCTGSPAGNYLATVTGTSGSLSHSTTVTYHVTAVADFAISASPTSVSVSAGVAGTSTITVASANGFAGTVTLATTTNSTNLVCTLTSTSITGGSGTSTLSCSASVAGNYLATVTGTSGTLSHSATVTYHIAPAPDFSLAASPVSVTANAGVAGTSTVTVAPLNGFTGTVTLATTTNSTSLVCTLSSTSIVGGSGTSTLSCHGSPTGNYLATVTGTSGGLSHSATVTFHVQDFAVSASPTSVPVTLGVAGTSTITVAPVNGFTGAVTLAVTTNSTSLSCTLSATSITGGSGASTLSCTGSPAGNYLATVRGSSATLSHSATVTYHVTAASDFAITASPTSASVNAGVPGTSTITIAPLNGFAGTVTLTVITNSTNLVCTLSPTSVTGGSGTSTLSCHGTPAGNYLATVTGTSGVLSHSATVTYHVQDFTITASSTSVNVNVNVAGTSTITVAPLNGFSGTVTLAVTTNSTNLSCTLSSTSVAGGSGSSTLSCTGSPAGNYLATVTGTSGALSHSASVVYHVTNAADFTLTASPISVTLNAGVTGTSTITVVPLNGFTGTVTLSVTTNSTNLVCTLSATSITGGSGTSTLSCHGSPASNYLATVTGTSGTLSHSATVTYHSQDFTVVASPTAVSPNVGVAGTSTVTVAALNGFSGTVSLAVTTNSTSLVCTLSSTSIIGGSGTSILSCTGSPAGNYLATVTGTSGTLSHSATVTYHVTNAADFTVTASPTSLTLNAGVTATSTITVASLNGFTGTVTLAVTTNSTNLVCSLSSASITGGSGTSTLSCHGSPAGNYLATVTGTSGSLSHSATVIYHMQDFSVAASPISVSASVGVAATSAITVAPINGFGGTVALAVTTNSTNLSCTLSSTSVAGGSGSSTLSCSSSVSGNYLATVTGTSGTLSHSASVTYHVTAAADFSLTANPISVIANVGSSATSTITVTTLNGFAGVVSLTATVSPTTGLTCTLTPTSITGSGTSTLSCTPSTNGSFTVTVTGTSGTLSHTATVTFTAQDFTVSANPASINVNTGLPGTSTISVAPVNGFAGTVALVATTNSTNLSCTLSSASITGGSGSSTLACSASVAGNYLATVTGTSGTLTHSTNVVYRVTTVAQPDFTIAANPTTVTVTQGTAGTSTITIAPVNGFTGTVTLTVTTNSVSLSCTLSSTSITGGTGTSSLSCTASAIGSFIANVSATSGTLSHSTAVTYVVASIDFSITANPTSVTTKVGVAGNSIITVAPLNGSTGTVSLTVTTNSTNLSCSLSSTSIAGGSGSSTLTCTGSVAGNYLATVTGTSGTLSHSASVTYHVTAVAPADFSLTAIPTSVSVTQGTPGTSTITVAPVNGFTGTVTLTATANAASLSCTLSPATVAGGSGTSTLSCTGSAVGSFLVNVTGVSGSLTHSVSVAFNVTSPTTKPVLLTFQGFDLDDFDNGTGQLQVFVNGHMVVDIPSGLNHLTGSGDYRPYDNRWVNFGPFDITSFVVQGQNTILFKDPQTSDHFGLVKNVTIVQGNTILLHVERARGVYPAFSFTYTFSIPPLVITSFTASTSTPTVEQNVTFTATYTGGTSPFRCIFSFGDFHFASVVGANGTCSATHDYDDQGTFHAIVIVIGASTTDLQMARINITVSGDPSVSSAVVSVATVDED